MNHLVFHFVCLLAALTQAPESATAVIGANAQKLSAEDIAEIKAAAKERTWLLEARETMVACVNGPVCVVVAYLYPQTETADMRRGLTAVLEPRSSNASGKVRSWQVKSQGSYAQVAIAGRDLSDVRDSQDLNRPFFVEGNIDDADLVDLARLMRASPHAPVSNRYSGLVQGRWPISYIDRTSADTIVVGLSEGAFSGQRVILRKYGTQWIVASAMYEIS